MSNEVTELVFILDRSGSMASMADEAIGGFNAFLEEQKTLPGEARLTLALFDHEYTLVHNGRDIKAVEPLTKETYTPRGTTALLDAVGRTLDDVGKRIHASEQACSACGSKPDTPTKVLVAVLTDGLENASKDYDKKRISEMIEHHKKDHDWQFMFLAANQDAFEEGGSIGVMRNMALNYSMDSAGFKKSFATMNASAKLYRSVGTQVFSAANIADLTDDDGNETQAMQDLMAAGSDDDKTEEV